MLKHGKGIYNLSPATQLKQPSENNQETENIIFFIPPKYLLCGKFYTKTSIELKPFFFIDDNLRLLSITFDYYRLSFYWLTTPGKYLWVNHICRVHPLSSLVLKVKNNHAHLDPEKKRILMTLVHQQSKPLRSKELAFLVTRCNNTIVAQFRVVLYFCH